VLNSSYNFDKRLLCIVQNYNAKISDFGLAKVWPPEKQLHVTTTVVGTPGYLDPEYFLTGNYINGFVEDEVGKVD